MARTLAVFVTVAVLVLCTSASAAPTASQITAPTDNTFVQADANAPTTLHVAGTTSGGAGNVDLGCYYGTSHQTLAMNVPVAGGAFSIDAPINTFTDNGAPRPYCVLRAVPTGDATEYRPDAASAFQGPHVGFGRFDTYTISGGPNDKAVSDYFTGMGQKQGYMDFYSLSGCALDYSFLFDPLTLEESASLFYCNGWVWVRNGCQTLSANCLQGTRSDLIVDGKQSYAPNAAASMFTNSDKLPGYQPLSYTKSIDPLNGDTHITEVDPTVNCLPKVDAFHKTPGDPAWATECTSFTSTGVTVNRTVTADHDGRRALFTDVFNSTDGQSHQVDVLYDEEFSGDSVATTAPTFQYPWLSNDFVAATKGTDVAGPATDGFTTFYVDGNGATADAFQNPQGAVTFSMAPKVIHWYGDKVYSYGTVQFTFTVPAGGGLTLTHSRIQGATKDEVNAAAAAERDRMGSPTVAITAPGNGATLTAGSVLVTGTSSDPGGAVTGVKVNGAAATLNPDGTWSQPVTLTPGANTLTAVASDAAGNTGTSSVSVTFTPPPPVVTPPAPAVDKTAPVIGMTVAKTKLGKLISKGLPVMVSCNEPCTFTLDLFQGRTKIGTAKGTLTKAGKLKVNVKLTKKAKKKLAKAKKLKATLKLKAKDTAGNSASKSKAVLFRR